MPLATYSYIYIFYKGEFDILRYFLVKIFFRIFTYDFG